MAREVRRPRRGRPVPEPLIGSYLLESITTGMYGERRNAIREYVQNSFDGIQAAVEAQSLRAGAGKVIVTLSDDRKVLKIADNGAGLSRRTAVDTLTAVGASKKVRGRAAGFRGIGRLAGVAFCSTLEFKTKAVDEDVETIVTFDCDALRRGMLNSGRKPAAELISAATTYEEVENSSLRRSFFEVTLRGLRDAPAEATDAAQLINFLSQVAPVDFHPDFVTLGAQIYEEAEAETTSREASGGPEDDDEDVDAEDVDDDVDEEGEVADEDVDEDGSTEIDWTVLDEDGAETMLERIPVPHVRLFVKAGDRGEENEVFKPFRPKQGIAGSRSVAVSDISVHSGASKAWWGWVGHKTRPGDYENPAVSGLRFRLKNIQIDGNDLIQFVPMTNADRSSFGRWSNWFLGEIHLDPRVVIPNARRDNFEEDERWLAIREEITLLCKALTKEARKVSADHQLSLEVLNSKIEKHQEAFVKESRSPKFDATKVNKLIAENDKLQKSLEKASDGVGAAAQVRLKALSKEVSSIKTQLLARPKGEAFERFRASIQDDVLELTLGILEDYLDLRDFDEVKAKLEKALKSKR